MHVVCDQLGTKLWNAVTSAENPTQSSLKKPKHPQHGATMLKTLLLEGAQLRHGTRTLPERNALSGS